MRTPAQRNINTFVVDVVRWNLQGGIAFQLFRLFLLCCMGFGVYAYSFQARYGRK